VILLSDLVRELVDTSRVGLDVAVSGVQQDSRDVKPGDLFVVRKGAQHDGAAYVKQAIENGASALLGGEEVLGDVSLPKLVTRDVALNLARAASAVYGHPSFSMGVIGITGTNGKTTCTHLLRDALNAARGDDVTGTIGTVGHRFRGTSYPTKHTTPEADELARVLRSMRDQGADYAAIEVSSIALVAKRVEAMRFVCAGFTNLTQDHLDYHGDMTAYGDAKARLFLDLGPGTTSINIADPFGRALADRVTVPCIRVSPEPDPKADIAVEHAAFDPVRFGMQASIRAFGRSYALRSSLIGKHNLENAVVALGIVSALGLDLERAVQANTTTFACLLTTRIHPTRLCGCWSR
jgi:UDP-N-acetylmuramoyl-L-alanyl-D-glutamate--2,6-diaminopimelate ligase